MMSMVIYHVRLCLGRLEEERISLADFEEVSCRLLGPPTRGPCGREVQGSL